MEFVYMAGITDADKCRFLVYPVIVIVYEGR